MRSAGIGILCLLVCLGCGTEPAPTTVVPLSEIRPELTAVAQKALPGVKFDSARKIQVNGEDAYQIRGKLPNGKVREVEVTVSGQVIEIN